VGESFGQTLSTGSGIFHASPDVSPYHRLGVLGLIPVRGRDAVGSNSQDFLSNYIFVVNFVDFLKSPEYIMM
jgi:hypothetical protein